MLACCDGLRPFRHGIEQPCSQLPRKASPSRRPLIDRCPYRHQHRQFSILYNQTPERDGHQAWSLRTLRGLNDQGTGAIQRRGDQTIGASALASRSPSLTLKLTDGTP